MENVVEVLEFRGDCAACANCGEKFSNSSGNIKYSLVVNESSIEEAGPHYVDPHPRFIEEAGMVFREYYCPSCGQLIFTETSHEDDPPVNDIHLDKWY